MTAPMTKDEVPVWELRRGDRFRLPAEYGIPEVFVFDHMDGMYCFAHDGDGQILNWSGPVVPEKTP